MLISTIIPTVGRASLAAAVESVLSQRAPASGHEVIVVNDSGAPLACGDWLRGGVTVIQTPGVERSRARNAGAARARGEFLHFLDDDDLLLPGAFARLERECLSSPETVWIYGAWQCVDRAGVFVEEFRPWLEGDIFPHLVAGEGLPLQASLVRASTFSRMGGFDEDPRLVGVEDRELGRRLASVGPVKYVDQVVARVHVGASGSTTNTEGLGYRDRLGRERVMPLTHSPASLRVSALDAYWRGRLVRACVGSALLNIETRQVTTACRRLTRGVTLAGHHVVQPAFWRGLCTTPNMSVGA